MESYFCGGIFLPPFNGPNEGNFSIALLGPITAIFGTSFWTTEVYNGYRMNNIIFLLVIVGGMI